MFLCNIINTEKVLMICGTNYFLKNNVAVKSSPKQNIHYCIMLKEVNASIIYGKMETLEC